MIFVQVQWSRVSTAFMYRNTGFCAGEQKIIFWYSALLHVLLLLWFAFITIRNKDVKYLDGTTPDNAEYEYLKREPCNIAQTKLLINTDRALNRRCFYELGWECE